MLLIAQAKELNTHADENGFTGKYVIALMDPSNRVYQVKKGDRDRVISSKEFKIGIEGLREAHEEYKALLESDIEEDVEIFSFLEKEYENLKAKK